MPFHLSLPVSLQNTTNSDSAFYELFSLPKNPDPSNPECKRVLQMTSIFLTHCVVNADTCNMYVHTACTYMYMYMYMIFI